LQHANCNLAATSIPESPNRGEPPLVDDLRAPKQFVRCLNSFEGFVV